MKKAALIAILLALLAFLYFFCRPLFIVITILIVLYFIICLVIVCLYLWNQPKKVSFKEFLCLFCWFFYWGGFILLMLFLGYREEKKEREVEEGY